MTEQPTGTQPAPPAGDPQLAAKRRAGELAVERYVRSGMRLGLGTGSTAIWAVRRIGQLVAAGSLTDVVGVPTSPVTEAEARELGIPLATLDEVPRLDLTVDGADEVSPQLDLIKGGGGAHLREKIIAQATEKLVIVVDESKVVDCLGATRAVPVEVVRPALRPEREFLEALGARVVDRTTPAGDPYVTAEGNRILDAWFGPIADARGLLAALEDRAGVMAVGLFLGFDPIVVVAGPDGVRELSAGS
jgi:ribose 5-phosphate isomerase A